MNQTINIYSVTKILMLLNLKWRGFWQFYALHHILSHTRTTLQGARQSTGKSWMLTILACVYIIAGERVIIGMPTMSQSVRILMRNIDEAMAQLERVLPIKRVKPDNVTEKIWDNGGSVTALSVNKTAQKEGYTGTLLIIDEGHRATSDILSIFLPFIDVAMTEGKGRIVVTGVGGFTSSLIEDKKIDNGGVFYPYLVTTADIVKEKPEYQVVFDEAKKILSEAEYAQMYDCLPVTTDAKYAFPSVPDGVEYNIAWNATPPVYVFGTDVGRESDPTVMTVLDVRGDKIELIDRIQITKTSFPEQASLLFEFINKYHYIQGNVIVEKNGLGHGLVDCLRVYIPNLKAVDLSYTLKESLINDLQRRVEKGTFGVKIEKTEVELKKVLVSVKANGKLEWTHSDDMSSVIMGLCSLHGTKGILPYQGVRSLK